MPSREPTQALRSPSRMYGSFGGTADSASSRSCKNSSFAALLAARVGATVRTSAHSTSILLSVEWIVEWTVQCVVEWL